MVVELCDIYFVFILFLTTFFLLKYGWTALHYAADRGFEHIVKILVEHRPNVHLQEKVLILIFDFNFSHFLICCCGSLFVVSCCCEWLGCIKKLFCFLFFF